MQLSTTPTIEGHTIREYKGVVTIPCKQTSAFEVSGPTKAEVFLLFLIFTLNGIILLFG